MSRSLLDVDIWAATEAPRLYTQWIGYSGRLMTLGCGFKMLWGGAKYAIHQSSIESTALESQAPPGAFHWWSNTENGQVGLDLDGGGTRVLLCSRWARKQELYGDVGIGVVDVYNYTRLNTAGSYAGWSMDFGGEYINPLYYY